MFIGLVLLVVGVIALLVQLGVLSGSIWSYTWPVILILLGRSFLFRRAWGGWGCCGWRSHRHEVKDK